MSRGIVCFMAKSTNYLTVFAWSKKGVMRDTLQQNVNLLCRKELLMVLFATLCLHYAGRYTPNYAVCENANCLYCNELRKIMRIMRCSRVRIILCEKVTRKVQ